MKHLMFISPGLTSYILPVLRGLAERTFLHVTYSNWNPVLEFGDIQPFEHSHISWYPVKEIRLLRSNRFGMYQVGLISFLLKERPDVIFLWANPRYISFWAVLIAGKLLKIPVYARGHGLIKQTKISLSHRWMYKIIIGLSTKYICYTPRVKESLLSVSIPENKLAVDYNSLYVENPVHANVKSGDEKGILFIGRLRPLCDINVLIEAAKIVRKRHKITLHIIGGGPLASLVNDACLTNDWIKFHGTIYEHQQICQISLQCRFGCYPGYAGLSVVHLMALSLPVVTHEELHAHGPEPEYIQHGKNGLFFGTRLDTNGLAESLEYLFTLPSEKIRAMQKRAYSTYVNLSSPPHHERLLDILLEEDVSS